MTAEQEFHSDALYRNRWLSLMSVDDLVEDFVNTLTKAGVVDNTYFLFSSDHGFRFGQYRMPEGKWNTYDNDLRIPMVVRGPGIEAGTVFDHVASNVDTMPTILGLAGIDTPDSMDGRSMAHLLVSNLDAAPAPTRAHLESKTVVEAAAPAWRTELLVEYYGLGDVVRYVDEGCFLFKREGRAREREGERAREREHVTPSFSTLTMVGWRHPVMRARVLSRSCRHRVGQGSCLSTMCYGCWFVRLNMLTLLLSFWAPFFFLIFPLFFPKRYEHLEDTGNNTFRTLRVIDSDTNLKYVEFVGADDWDHNGQPQEYELFDLNADPWELKNIFSAASPTVKADLHQRVDKLFRCRGSDTCN